jgi:CBS domain-containing membrane protein
VAILVKHIMSSPVVSFFAEQTLPLAEDVMRLKHLRHLPVTDERGLLVGIVSHRDLLRAGAADVRIEQVMTRDVWTVHATTLATAAGQLLLDHRWGCLPVVDARGYLVGIVTERDFLELALRTLRPHDPEGTWHSPARKRRDYHTLET